MSLPARVNGWLPAQTLPLSGCHHGRTFGERCHGRREAGVVNRDDELAAVVDDLAARHPLFARITIERLVARTFEEYHSAPIQSFVPCWCGGWWPDG
jgi:hypothetical protein